MQVPSRTERINKLLDLAKTMSGSDYKTAKLIGVTRMNVSQWRKGKSCPIEKQAILANLAGLDATEVVSYALIEGAADHAEKERLYTAVGKTLVPTGATGFFVTSDKGDSASSWRELIRCAFGPTVEYAATFLQLIRPAFC